MADSKHVLVVDDDDINLMILIKGVQEAGYKATPFSSGDEAWAYLQKNPTACHLALLDKMMPGMSGLDLLKRIKADESMQHMPVILQTGDVGVAQMREGLEAGAYYYLTKPFHPEIMIAILNAACKDADMRAQLSEGKEQPTGNPFKLLVEGEFVFTNHLEARELSKAISRLSKNPVKIAEGIYELLANAVEHGNFSIGYDRKRNWMMACTWDKELEGWAAHKDYSDRRAHLHFSRTEDDMRLIIRDEGKGFDWRAYTANDSELLKLNEPNGRGIVRAMTNLAKVQYMGAGNEVFCSFPTPHCDYASGHEPAVQPKAANGG